MASMDNLRDKIRSRRADTSELDAVPIAAPATAARTDHFKTSLLKDDTGPFMSAQDLFDEAPVSQSNPASQSNTDSLISEIFADDPVVPPSFKSSDKPKKVKAQAEPRKPLSLPFLNRFKHLEINRRMLLVSLAVAALASFLSMAYINGIAQPLGDQAKMVKVISLKKDVPAGTEISEAMLEIKEVPRAYLPEGALVYEKNMKLLGMITTASVYKGEILNNSRIEDPEERGYFKVPAGHRAMLIKTNTAMLVTPSTKDRKEYIDLIATIPDPNPARQGKLITYPILQRALVLPLPKSGGKEGASVNVPTNSISLAVPEDRVRLMVTLMKKGEFEAVPRAPEDENTTPEEYTVQEIMDALQGKFESTPVSATRDEKPEPDPAPAKVAAPAPQAAPVDLSGGSSRSYRAPARAPVYRAPVRSTPVYRAPARSSYRAPVRSAPRAVSRPAARPAARAAAPAASSRRSSGSRMPRVTIQGGSITQAN